MGQDFHQKVVEVVKQIPYGRITTYGHIAGYLGNRRSARMVGWTLNKHKGNREIPAHRVVNRKGLLTGKIYFEGINMMQDLLMSEGIEIKDSQVVNMEKYLWDPSVEL